MLLVDDIKTIPHKVVEEDTNCIATKTMNDVAAPSMSTHKSTKDQTSIQLEVMKNSFQFYHPWQPSSFESLDDEYYNDINSTINEQSSVNTTNANILVVKDLPTDVDKDNLTDFFSLFGQVSATSISRGGIGTITFEEGGDGASKVLASQPIKIFGQEVEVEVGSIPKAGRRLQHQRRTTPFPIIIAPSNYGPLKEDTSTKYSSPNKKASDASNQSGKSNELQVVSNKRRGIFGKQSEHNGLVSSAPPESATQSQMKASLNSLLSSPMSDPLFDDDDDDHITGESWHRKHKDNRPYSSKKNLQRFHSDNALISWVWAPENSSPTSQSELDLSCTLIRGRAVHEKLPLLATTDISISNDENNKKVDKEEVHMAGLDNTNLNLLHKTIEISPEKNDSENTISPDGSYKLYQALHPGLAPLISCTRYTSKNDDTEITEALDHQINNFKSKCFISVFDITPTNHRSLSELLRTDNFLSRPLFPGMEGHEVEPLTNNSISPSISKKKGLPPWLRGGSRKQDNTLCTCHKSIDFGWGKGGGIDSSSEPTMLHEDSESEENEDISTPNQFLNDLRRIGDATRAIIDQPPPKLRRRRPWKSFKVGSCYRADVADLRIRFLALQLFNTISYCHSRGITLGEQLSPDRIYIQDDGWVRLVVPITESKPENNIQKGNKASRIQVDNEEEISSPNRRKWRNIFHNNRSPQSDKLNNNEEHQTILPYPGYGDVPTVQWQRGQLTNLCYLIMLNAAAGRTVGDHSNPPILPWVTDFTSEIELEGDQGKAGASGSPWRDLSKSRFRLKKGDDQLDHTYMHASPPHHVPESICELTYTVYRARALPISHLKTVVRDDFIGQHYPSSVESMYKWTPDEATLEFYLSNLQPDIFKSLHEDMDDMALPHWCNNSSDAFISYHRSLLESAHVSQQLHKWIDLNFGDALSGKRAVAEKNVVLSVMPYGNGGCQDQCQGSCHSVFASSSTSTSAGETLNMRTSRTQFVQLFIAPHPKKHNEIRKTVATAIRTTFKQGNKNMEDRDTALIGSDDDSITDDFESRKQRDISTIGSLLRDCYTSARVIPSQSVDDAINKLQMGTLDIRQSSTDFSFPQHLKEAYQVFSKVQSLTFRRSERDLDTVDDNRSTSEQVQRIIQSGHCLESFPSSYLGLILPTILYPLASTDSFIEGCAIIGSSFTDRFHKYVLSLSRGLLSGMFLYLCSSVCFLNLTHLDCHPCDVSR